MEPETHDPKWLTSRRSFLKSTGVVATGLALGGRASAQGATETLALNGGPKAVTVPDADAIKWPRYGQAEEQAVLELVRNPNYAPIAELEKDWCAHFGVPYAKAHYNGTSVLTSMFFALKLPPGSEILVPSYTFFATIVPMRFFGLVPVFVDINPRTLNFDLEDAKKRLTKDTKAVLPVHWIGLPSDMDLICDWAKGKGLIVLEDAATVIRFHRHHNTCAKDCHTRTKRQNLLNLGIDVDEIRTCLGSNFALYCYMSAYN